MTNPERRRDRSDVHRIAYQSDEVVVTACGLTHRLSRQAVDASPWLTIWRGKQTCPDCPDELAELPQVIKDFIQVPNLVPSGPMIPKQLDSIFDLLEQHDCTEISLRRDGTVQMSGHEQPVWVVRLLHEGEEREWRDHALYRLMAEVVVDITNRSITYRTTPDDELEPVRPEIP